MTRYWSLDAVLASTSIMMSFGRALPWARLELHEAVTATPSLTWVCNLQLITHVVSEWKLARVAHAAVFCG